MIDDARNHEREDLLISCTDGLEIWEHETPDTLRDCLGLYRDYFTTTEADCFLDVFLMTVLWNTHTYD
jgi:hypothetical protein